MAQAPRPRAGAAAAGPAPVAAWRRWEPWQHPVLAAPLDFSFRGATSLTELLSQEPRAAGPAGRSRRGRLLGAALRLNNNALRSLAALPPALERLLECPQRLQWLDLSFNQLPAIDPVLTRYENLHRLDLHGNSIGSLAEVDKLAALARLRRLTLHGNPVEEQPGYRGYVLAALPQLRALDFSGVTKQERSAAARQRLRGTAGTAATHAPGVPRAPRQ